MVVRNSKKYSNSSKIVLIVALLIVVGVVSLIYMNSATYEKSMIERGVIYDKEQSFIKTRSLLIQSNNIVIYSGNDDPVSLAIGGTTLVVGDLRVGDRIGSDNLAGSGTAYACVDSDGILIRQSVPCV